MQYARLAAYFERLEATSGRLGMTAILAEMLAEVPAKDMRPVVRLLQGAVAPDWEGLELGLAEKQIVKALALATGRDADTLTAEYKRRGDLGLVAQDALAPTASKRQASLFGAQPLTVASVFGTLLEIANTTGTGSQGEKQRLLSKLLLMATPLEARYLTRTVAGKLRLGVADMTFLDALAAWHLGRGVRSVQDMAPEERAEQEALRVALEQAYDLRSDMAVVAEAIARGGLPAVEALGIAIGTPVRPMAAERIKTLPEILEKMGGRVAMEYKYDGLRIQAHVPAKGPVRLFSRRLEELTAQFPDIVAGLHGHFRGKDCIVEGEALALDAQGAILPFQEVSRRRGRKTDLDRMTEEVPITLFLFDCLADGGASTMALTHEERRARLAAMVGDGKGPATGAGAGPQSGPVRLSALIEATDVEGMESFFTEAVEGGAEGIMCKDPRAPYKAGSRGYAWIKFKTDYTEELVDTLDLVAIGAFHGRGRRAGWYGALLMAAPDPATGMFQSVCKLGTGFSDELLQGLKDRFAGEVSAHQPKNVESGLVPDVWFHPRTVMEVQAAELSLSPTHRAAFGRFRPDAGLAARFPRFTRWRDDKSPTQATSVDELASMFKAQ